VPGAARLRITLPTAPGAPFTFAGMFAGLGDARHMFATLADLGLQLRQRGAGARELRIHLTAVRARAPDVHRMSVY
jgi:hypothetical protein